VEILVAAVKGAALHRRDAEVAQAGIRQPLLVARCEFASIGLQAKLYVVVDLPD
jgi:hypothetical protein